MKVSVRSLSGETTEIDVESTATIAELKVAIQAATKIPVAEQRLVFAGSQLEEVVTEAFRKRRGATGAALNAALGVAGLTDGTPLTLEHYGLQKGSIINIVRRLGGSSTPTSGGYDAGPCAAAVRGATPPPPLPELPLRRSSEACDAQSEQRVAPPVPAAALPRAAASPMAAGVPALDHGARWAAGAEAAKQRGSAAAAAASGGAEKLALQLDALSDEELHILLLPLLEKRPALATSMLNAAKVRLRELQLQQDPQQRQQQQRAAWEPAAKALARHAGETEEEGLSFRKGDPVHVWSNSHHRWCEGSVLRIALASDGKIPKGSIEVSFELGEKWIAPAESKRVLRKR